jgi:RNA polymerase sigma-70 factor (ECF subfamily)
MTVDRTSDDIDLVAEDRDPDDWVAALTCSGSAQMRTHRRLHALLLRAARSEVMRRSGKLNIAGVELDDLAHQAAADAMVAILAKIGQFRGESQFTTWAYKFVILEVSAKVGRHFWQHHEIRLGPEDWDRLPHRFGVDPADDSQTRELVEAVRLAVTETFTARQRQVFVALVLDGVPLDALALELDTNRNAIYKMMFDARSKLRAALVAQGFLTQAQVRHS